ncbi:DUF6020 family protein [Halobacillus rhizosphaerae]|uniref:DUF6020 family protein n=1 Tax=Halobacillus rhizosphaerae TaxID=3064889 RepID=UPI00398B3791
MTIFLKSIQILVGLIASLASTAAVIPFYHSFEETPGWVTGLIFVLFFLFYFGVFQAFIHNSSRVGQFLKRPLVWTFTILFVAFLVVSLQGSMEALEENPWLNLTSVYIVVSITLMIVVLFTLYFLVHHSVELHWKEVSHWKILLYAIPCIAVWLLYLAGFYPGNMSPDSLSHWRQIHTHEFSNWHPVIYTWFMMLLTSVWESPAVVALAQIVILAVIFGYGMFSLERSGLPRKWIWLITILFALSPINGIYSVILWKDVLFNSFVLLFTVLMYNAVASQGSWLRSNWHMVLLGVTVLGISFIRNNGLPIFVVMAVLLFLAYRTYLKKLLITVGAVAIIYFVVTGPLYNYLDVTPADPDETLGIPTQQFARVITEDGQLTSEQENYLNEIMPLKLWKKNYNPYLTDHIKFAKEYHSQVIFDDFPYYLKTWAAVLKNNPGLYFAAYFDETSIIWQMNEPEKGYTNIDAKGIHQPNDYHLKASPLSDSLHEFLLSVNKTTEEHVRGLMWRPAVYTAIIILAGFAAFLKGGLRVWLIPLPVLLNTMTLLLAIPAQDFRYQLANSLVFYLMIAVGFLTFKTKRIDQYE